MSCRIGCYRYRLADFSTTSLCYDESRYNNIMPRNKRSNSKTVKSKGRSKPVAGHKKEDEQEPSAADLEVTVLEEKEEEERAGKEGVTNHNHTQKIPVYDKQPEQT